MNVLVYFAEDAYVDANSVLVMPARDMTATLKNFAASERMSLHGLVDDDGDALWRVEKGRRAERTTRAWEAF